MMKQEKTLLMVCNMWHWDQGRISYFQFDALKAISQFVCKYDFKAATKDSLLKDTGLTFSAPDTYNPWRNYSRILKLCLLVSEQDGIAIPTPVAKLLATSGAVTCDEYLHFISQAFTQPSPALQDWDFLGAHRYPLLFALKYLLAKVASGAQNSATLDEIIGAYSSSDFLGDEGDDKFIRLVQGAAKYPAISKNGPYNLIRQAKESLKVLSQISYLHYEKSTISVSLAPEDAREIFQELSPIGGEREADVCTTKGESHDCNQYNRPTGCFASACSRPNIRWRRCRWR